MFILYSRRTLNWVRSHGWGSCALKHLGVGVGSLLLSQGEHDVHQAPDVLDTTLSATSLLLLLLVNLNVTGKEKKKKNICYFSQIFYVICNVMLESF